MKKIVLLKDQQGSICVEPQEMTKVLNEYCLSVFIMDAREHREVNSDVLKKVYITEKGVLLVLKCINVDKSLGPDQVYLRTLWEARAEIAAP